MSPKICTCVEQMLLNKAGLLLNIDVAIPFSKNKNIAKSSVSIQGWRGEVATLFPKRNSMTYQGQNYISSGSVVTGDLMTKSPNPINLLKYTIYKTVHVVIFKHVSRSVGTMRWGWYRQAITRQHWFWLTAHIIPLEPLGLANVPHKCTHWILSQILQNEQRF